MSIDKFSDQLILWAKRIKNAPQDVKEKVVQGLEKKQESPAIVNLARAAAFTDQPLEEAVADYLVASAIEQGAKP